MRYFHTLDPDQIRELEEQDRRDLEDYARAAELLAEDAAMERYYERRHNQQWGTLVLPVPARLLLRPACTAHRMYRQTHSHRRIK